MSGRQKVMLTGFGPFESVLENPSEHLARSSGHPHEILPVSYDAVNRFLGSLDPRSFDVLLLMGLDGYASRPKIEMVAKNIVEARLDVDGFSPRCGPIRSSMPPILHGTLWPVLNPLESCCADVSLDAGAFLCNYIYFEALLRFPKTRIGFLHVPLASTMAIETQLEVLSGLVGHIESHAVAPMPLAL